MSEVQCKAEMVDSSLRWDHGLGFRCQQRAYSSAAFLCNLEVFRVVRR